MQYTQIDMEMKKANHLERQVEVCDAEAELRKEGAEQKSMVDQGTEVVENNVLGQALAKVANNGWLKLVHSDFDHALEILEDEFRVQCANHDHRSNT